MLSGISSQLVKDAAHKLVLIAKIMDLHATAMRACSDGTYDSE